MDDPSSLYKASLDEIEHLISTKSVVGDPIQVEGATIIPLMAAGFGFGAGGGTGTAPGQQGSGTGQGTGAGGGVRPVALIIVDKNGVRVENLPRHAGLEALGTAIGKAMEARMAKPG